MAELEQAGLPDPPAHQRGARPHGRRLSAVRRVDRSADQPRPGGAADDPPPVRPGRVRQRTVVPSRGRDHRRRHARCGPRHAGQVGTCRLRHVDLVATSTRTASLVVVLREGSVKQELVPLDEPYDQESLDDVADLLNAELGDKSARQVANRLEQLATIPDDARAWPCASPSGSNGSCASSMPRRSRTSSPTAC